jgi:hypothetical protein
MLLKEIIIVYFENHTIQIHSVSKMYGNESDQGVAVFLETMHRSTNSPSKKKMNYHTQRVIKKIGGTVMYQYRSIIANCSTVAVLDVFITLQSAY